MTAIQQTDVFLIRISERCLPYASITIKKDDSPKMGIVLFLWMFFGRKRMSLTASHVC